MQKNIIIGTAGHINHGKSSLIKALTGDETDRLAEEKERGISIEIGFSHLESEKTKANNLNLEIIDVPGHEKFVNKMLSAAGGVDLALIVAAANEGIMPQTKEHLAILDLLEVEKAIIVINKIDLVAEEWLELVEMDLMEQFKNTFAADAELIRVSSKTNKGIDKLKDLIINKALKIKGKNKNKISYFPIDRVFSLKGQGTIVTGTLFSGNLKQNDELFLYPGKKKLKIKTLESHGREIDKASAGSRVGINFSGIKRSKISSGNIIAAKNSLLQSRFFEAEVQLLENLDFIIQNGDKVHFHTASFETTAKIYFYNKKEVYPGEKRYIKLILKEEIALFFKQKFILRRISPLETIAGGKILDVDPPPRRKTDDNKIIKTLDSLSKTSEKEAVEIFIEHCHKSSVELEFLKKKSALIEVKLKEILSILINEKKIIELLAEKSYLHQQTYKKLKKNILNFIYNYHQKHKLEAGIKKEELRSKLNFNISKKEFDSLIQILVSTKLIEEKNNLLALIDFEINLSPEMKKIKEKVLDSFQKELFSPPVKKNILSDYKLEDDFFNYLENEGLLIRLTEEIYFHYSVLNECRKMLKSYFEKHRNLKLAEFRDLINSSRRYALPLLEKMDQLKICRRKGDLRYPGKNLKATINLLDEKLK